MDRPGTSPPTMMQRILASDFVFDFTRAPIAMLAAAVAACAWYSCCIEGWEGWVWAGACSTAAGTGWCAAADIACVGASTGAGAGAGTGACLLETRALLSARPQAFAGAACCCATGCCATGCCATGCCEGSSIATGSAGGSGSFAFGGPRAHWLPETATTLVEGAGADEAGALCWGTGWALVAAGVPSTTLVGDFGALPFRVFSLGRSWRGARSERGRSPSRGPSPRDFIFGAGGAFFLGSFFALVSHGEPARLATVRRQCGRAGHFRHRKTRARGGTHAPMNTRGSS